MHVDSLPLGAARYFRSRVFSVIPRGQRREHSLRADVWSRIHVLDGTLSVVTAAPARRDILRAGETLDVLPGVPHRLEAVGAEPRFVLHLYRVWCDSTRADVARWESEGGRVLGHPALES